MAPSELSLSMLLYAGHSARRGGAAVRRQPAQRLRTIARIVSPVWRAACRAPVRIRASLVSRHDLFCLCYCGETNTAVPQLAPGLPGVPLAHCAKSANTGPMPAGLSCSRSCLSQSCAHGRYKEERGCVACNVDDGLHCPEAGMIRPHAADGVYIKDGEWKATGCHPREACSGGASCFQDENDFFLATPELTSEKAELWCRERSGHLASIESQIRHDAYNFSGARAGPVCWSTLSISMFVCNSALH